MADLIPDPSITLIQLGLFLLTFFVLKFLVFDPYLKLIHLRTSKTSGLKEAAEKAKVASEKYRQQYEEFIKEERKKINQMVELEKRKMNDETRDIIQLARTKASEKLDTVRKSVEADVSKIRKELEPLAQEFSSKIASKLVGATVTIKEMGKGEEVRA